MSIRGISTTLYLRVYNGQKVLGYVFEIFIIARAMWSKVHFIILFLLMIWSNNGFEINESNVSIIASFNVGLHVGIDCLQLLCGLYVKLGVCTYFSVKSCILKKPLLPLCQNRWAFLIFIFFQKKATFPLVRRDYYKKTIQGGSYINQGHTFRPSSRKWVYLHILSNWLLNVYKYL